MKLTDEAIIQALQDGKGVSSKAQFATTWVLKKDGEDAFKVERIDPSGEIWSVVYALSLADLAVDDWEVSE